MDEVTSLQEEHGLRVFEKKCRKEYLALRQNKNRKMEKHIMRRFTICIHHKENTYGACNMN
jgi:hypothetical protein